MSPTGNAFLASFAIGALVSASAAVAAESGRTSDIHTRYLQDRTQCMQITSTEARKTCLREAGAAQTEARRGALNEPQENYEKNRLARCSYYTDPKERGYCERRMRGEGTVSGSVEEGAILRSLVVTVPASD
jgi:hypothetical protein